MVILARDIGAVRFYAREIRHGRHSEVGESLLQAGESFFDQRDVDGQEFSWLSSAALTHIKQYLGIAFAQIAKCTAPDHRPLAQQLRREKGLDLFPGRQRAPRVREDRPPRAV